MHTTRLEDHSVYIHHNGDFRGNILFHVQVKPELIDKLPKDGPWKSENGDFVIDSAPWGWQVSIPMEVLEEVVASKYADKLMTQIEDLDYDQILARIMR